MMKGLLKLGIDMVGPYDWYDDFSDVIVARQTLPEGYWDQGGYPTGYRVPSTTWAMLTLMKAAPDPVTPRTPVGGTADAANKLLILLPWLGLAAIGAGTLLVLRRRRAQS